MQEADKAFTGSIPENYDRHMVPLIFAPYAEDLANRVAALHPGHILETAAGTGVVTRALASRLPESAVYVVTDLNRPMLDYAASQHAADRRILWRQADALALPFADAVFDAVLCQFGAMFFPDRVAGFAQARRVLRPGGSFLFNVWDRIEDNDFAHEVTVALAELFPDDPPRFMARTPHGYHDESVIRRDLDAAGFTDVVVETIAAQSPAPSAWAAAVAYCQGTVLRTELEARKPGCLDDATRHAAAALERMFGNGPISGKIQAHIIGAR